MEGSLTRYINYMWHLPYKVNHYGLKNTVYKVLIDISLVLGIERHIPRGIRWAAAHSFHSNWKLSQRRLYGEEEYNRRIDTRSRENLTEFYEMGLDFTGKTVVDVGCGTRGVLPSIAAAVKIGVDPSIGDVQHGFNFPDDTIYLSEKIEECSLKDCTADIVVCNNTLNHVENPELALSQIYRILKLGGLLLLEVLIEPMNIAHTHTFTAESLGALMRGCFTPIRVKHEQLHVGVDIDEKLDGKLPMRWGGVFQK